MSDTLTHKQRVIEAQEHQIAVLDAANHKLLSALSQLKEHHQTNNKLNTNQRFLEELSELKSSSCWDWKIYIKDKLSFDKRKKWTKDSNVAFFRLYENFNRNPINKLRKYVIFYRNSHANSVTLPLRLIN